MSSGDPFNHSDEELTFATGAAATYQMEVNKASAVKRENFIFDKNFVGASCKCFCDRVRTQLLILWQVIHALYRIPPALQMHQELINSL